MPQPERISASLGVIAGSAARLRHRRAVDLILPPMAGTQVRRFDMSCTSPSDVISTIVGERRTGCMRSINDQVSSRSALLLYQGKVVGCIYGARDSGEPKPTEPSLVLALSQLALPETRVQLYDLPAEIIASMAAIFLGQPAQDDEITATDEYLNLKLAELSATRQTGCLVFTLASGDTLLVFVYKGAATGCFQVQEQHYSSAMNMPSKLLCGTIAASGNTYVLPTDFDITSGNFGYSLE
jgi:hypothetical protein